MKSTVWGLLLMCIYAHQLPAQITDLQQLLVRVENENQDLKAFREQLKAQEFRLKATNNLTDPQISAYYLPFGEHTTPDYWEFEITQTVDFPSVYKARSRWIQQRTKKQKLEYEALRREKLLEASLYYYELAYLAGLEDLYRESMENAIRALDHNEYLYEKGEVGKLEISKARLAGLEPQFRLEEIQQKSRDKLLNLQYLCNCDDIPVDSFSRDYSFDLASLDTIVKEARQQHITLQIAQAEIKVASEDLDLSRTKKWPSLSAGFNYQGVPQNNYAGFVAGLSVPLWSEDHKVEAGRAALSAMESGYSAKLGMVEKQLKQDYQAFETKYRKYIAYRDALQELQTETLLLQAYELGELSFLDYYQEIQFYRNARENLLNIEKELYQLKAKILQYEL